MSPFAIIPALVAAYLLGGIPFGLLIARWRGVDIRKAGSGNIGATNVFRCVGKGWGILTFVCDALKGYVSAAWLPLAAGAAGGVDAPGWLGVAGGLAAVAGHNWPVFLRFRGGKGVATSAGVLLGIAPAAVGIGFAVWLLVFVTGRFVSLASITACVVLAVVAWPLYRAGGWLVPSVLSLLGAAAVWRHKGNIQRLLKGTENRFEFGRKRAEREAP